MSDSNPSFETNWCLVVAMLRIVGAKKLWVLTCQQSHSSYPQKEHSPQDDAPVPRRVLETPELWGGGFEAKANFGPTALLLT